MMTCPRCGEHNASDELFCLYCQWAFSDKWSLCPTCNATLKGTDICDTCHEHVDWTSNSLDDWYGSNKYN
jgi:uncharacterized membrane protein YvbJ